MGFHTLAIQKKGDEVWRVLSSTKNEFEKFGGLMDKVKKQVDTVQNTLGEIGGKTKTINRALKNVSSIETGAPVSNLLGFEEIASVAPLTRCKCRGRVAWSVVLIAYGGGERIDPRRSALLYTHLGARYP